jgi:hypothetical protein
MYVCIYLQAALLLMPVRLSHTAGQLSGFCPRSIDGFARRTPATNDEMRST